MSPIVGSTTQTEQAARELWAHVLAVKRLRLMLSGTVLLVSAVLIVIAGVLVATSR